MIFSSLFGQVLASHDLKMPSDLFIFQNNQFLQFSRAENVISVIKVARKKMTLESNLISTTISKSSKFGNLQIIEPEKAWILPSYLWNGKFAEPLIFYLGDGSTDKFSRTFVFLYKVLAFR